MDSETKELMQRLYQVMKVGLEKELVLEVRQAILGTPHVARKLQDCCTPGEYLEIVRLAKLSETLLGIEYETAEQIAADLLLRGTRIQHTKRLLREMTDRPTKAAVEAYRDGCGVPFAQLLVRLDPPPKRVYADDEGVVPQFRQDFAGSPCWWCGYNQNVLDYRPMEVHHLCAGSVGRSHERTLLTWTCRKCHEEHVGKADLGRWLFLKWKYDQSGTNWVLIAHRFGKRLPPLVTSQSTTPQSTEGSRVRSNPSADSRNGSPAGPVRSSGSGEPGRADSP